MTTEIMKRETITVVRDTPVEKQHFLQPDYWHDWVFIEHTAYEISNRQVFTPPNGCDYAEPRYQFELWDDQGLIGAYRMKTKVWNDNVKMLANKQATR